MPSHPHPYTNQPPQHADTKEYFGGCQHEIKEQQGHISCMFDLKPAPLDAPLKFKAWISPRGKQAVSQPLVLCDVYDCGPAASSRLPRHVRRANH